MLRQQKLSRYLLQSPFVFQLDPSKGRPPIPIVVSALFYIFFATKLPPELFSLLPGFVFFRRRCGLSCSRFACQFRVGLIPVFFLTGPWQFLFTFDKISILPPAMTPPSPPQLLFPNSSPFNPFPSAPPKPPFLSPPPFSHRSPPLLLPRRTLSLGPPSPPTSHASTPFYLLSFRPRYDLLPPPTLSHVSFEARVVLPLLFPPLFARFFAFFASCCVPYDRRSLTSWLTRRSPFR